MLDNPAYASIPDAAAERRVHARHRVQALAYLDIEGDNGGFVLDVSEEGMAFQAVGPLQHQAEVKLRIQVPKSRTRIETSARIVWLGESNRVAGVRFLDLPSEGREQIQEWIRSENTPEPVAEKASTQISYPHTQDVSVSSDTLPASRQDRWLSVMGDMSQEPQIRRPTPQAAAEGQTAVLPEASTRISQLAGLTDLVVDHAEPTGEAVVTGKAPKSAAAEPPALATMPPAAIQETVQPAEIRGNVSVRVPPTPLVAHEGNHHDEDTDWPVRRRESANGNGFKTAALISHDADKGADKRADREEDDTTWPAGILRREPAGVGVERIQAVSPIEARPRVPAELPRRAPQPLATPVNFQEQQMGRIRAASSAATWPVEKSVAQKWIAAAAVFVVCALCLAVWMGLRSSRADSAPVESVSANQPATSDGSVASGSGVANDVASKNGGDANTGGDSSSKHRKAALAAGSTAMHRSQRDIPLEQNLAPLSAKEPEQSSAAPPPAIESPAPPAQSIAAPAPAPVVQNPAPAAPAARMVAGRLLRPTDRFNPCHLTYRVEPAYPSEAQDQRVEGTVKIHQAIGADGSVRTVTLISGPAALAPAALDAAQHWRYLPALLNGEPVETEQDIQIEFHLPR